MPTLVRIAKTGLFNQQGLTPIDSAGEADLWTAFSILNLDNAQSQLEGAILEESRK